MNYEKKGKSLKFIILKTEIMESTARLDINKTEIQFFFFSNFRPQIAHSFRI